MTVPELPTAIAVRGYAVVIGEPRGDFGIEEAISRSSGNQLRGKPFISVTGVHAALDVEPGKGHLAGSGPFQENAVGLG